MSRTPTRDKLALAVAELDYVRDRLIVMGALQLAEVVAPQIRVLRETIEMLHHTVWPLADSDYEYWVDVDNKCGWMCVPRGS